MKAIIASALMTLSVTAAVGAGPLEQGTFVNPAALPRRPAPMYSLEQLQNIVRIYGPKAPIDVQKAYADIQQASQPMEMPYGGGKLVWNPANPAQQTYVPTLKEAPVKVCTAEFTYSYWIDSKGVVRIPHVFDEQGKEWTVGDYQIKTLTEFYEAGSLDATPEKVSKVRECLARAMDYLHLR
jgi:hypothetical protein